MAAKEKRDEQEVEVEQEQKQDKKPDKFQLQLVSESHVHYNEVCGFGPYQGGNTWVKLIGPEGVAQSWGYFPMQHEEVPLKPSQGHIVDPSTTGYMADQIRSFEIDASKATAVASLAEQKRAQPGEYDVLENNCADFVMEVAEVAGVTVSLSEILLPNQKALLQRMAQLRAEKAGGGKSKEVAAQPPPKE